MKQPVIIAQTRTEHEDSLGIGDWLYVPNLVSLAVAPRNQSRAAFGYFNEILYYWDTTLLAWIAVGGGKAFISTADNLALAQRSGDVLIGIRDKFTGEYVALQKTTVRGDQTTITAGDVDGIIYFSLTTGGVTEYFRRVMPLGIWVTWWGAKALGQITSTAQDGPNAVAINAACAAAVKEANAIHRNTYVYLPPGQGFAVNDTITVPTGVGFVCDSAIISRIPVASPGIVVGTAGVRNDFYTRFKINIFYAGTLDAGTFWINNTSAGVRFYNLQTSINVEIVRSERFTKSIELIGDGFGVQYNTFNLGSLALCKYGVYMDSNNTGWVNENIFFGGRFGGSPIAQTNGKSRYGVWITSQYGYYSNNNNFYKPDFELGAAGAVNGGAGEVVPIVVEYGTGNNFIDCRNESNNVFTPVGSITSFPFVRTLNASANTVVSCGTGTTGRIEDLGSVPSTILTERQNLVADGFFNSVYNPVDFLRKITPYSATQIFAADELFFANQANGNILDILTSTAITADSLTLTSTQGVAIRVDTNQFKRFAVKKQVIYNPDVNASPAFSGSGRVRIRAYDASGNVLGATGGPYVLGLTTQAVTYQATWGGSYTTQADTYRSFFFAVTSTVAYVDVILTGGTNSMVLKGFAVSSLDGSAPVIRTKKKIGMYASQAPTTLAWQVGDIVYNYIAGTNILGWRCIASGTPGTWEEMAVVIRGTGAPEGVRVGIPGDEYTDKSGTAGTIKWVKQSGTGNTGWAPIA